MYATQPDATHAPDDTHLFGDPERRHAHAGADAHARDADLLARAAQLRQQGADLPRAGAAEGVAKGNGAALWVDLGLWDAELVDAPDALAGKRLVDFVNVDIVEGDAGLAEDERDGGPRADAHEERLDADDARLHVLADDGLAEALGDAAAHEQHRGRAVADLARVAGVNAAVLCESRPDLAERGGRHALAHAVVARHADLALLVRLGVRPLDRQRHNLLVEEARLLRLDRLCVRGRGELVLCAAGHAAVARHVFGQLAHGDAAVCRLLVRLEQVGEFGHGLGTGVGASVCWRAA